MSKVPGPAYIPRDPMGPSCNNDLGGKMCGRPRTTVPTLSGPAVFCLHCDQGAGPRQGPPVLLAYLDSGGAV